MIFGIIGCGKMGGTMLTRLVTSGYLAPEKIIAADKCAKTLDRFKSQLHIGVTDNNCAVAEKSDVLLLSVLPQLYPAVLSEVAPCLKKGACVITIAPGYTIEKIASYLREDIKIVRAMPNTPAMIGEGMIAVCRAKNTDDETFESAKALLSNLGRTEEIEESQINAVIGVSGSAPAYVFMFIEALADAGVLGGLHRDQAIRFAAQAVMGSAKLQIETGTHPEVLKDMVCSPAGTTIEAAAVLEKEGLRNAVISAAKAAMDKAQKMG